MPLKNNRATLNFLTFNATCTLVLRVVSMTIEDNKEAGYITLKEASERFGYSPDYVGQLIRKGKIEGKQVYSNLAWMTTVDSIEEYLSREKHTAKEEVKTSAIYRLSEYLMSQEGTLYLSWSLKGILMLLVVTALFVFYFLSIALDHKMARDAEHRLAAHEIVLPLSAHSAEADRVTYEK